MQTEVEVSWQLTKNRTMELRSKTFEIFEPPTLFLDGKCCILKIQINLIHSFIQLN